MKCTSTRVTGIAPQTRGWVGWCCWSNYRDRKTRSFFHPPTLVAPFGRGILNREGRWNMIPIWPAMLVDPSLAAWCWFFWGGSFLVGSYFPWYHFSKIMKMTLLKKIRENISPSRAGQKTWVKMSVLREAFGLNSAEYTHSCANLAHDEVGPGADRLGRWWSLPLWVVFGGFSCWWGN